MPRRNALKRRPTRKYRRRSTRFRRIPRSVGPYSIVRRLVSVYSTALDPSAGASAYGYLDLNAAFDPTGSFSGQRPLGFDQYITLYKRNCVIAYSCKLEYCATDNTVPMMVGFTPLHDTTKRVLEHYKELPGTVSAIVTPDIDKLTLFARGSVKRQLMPAGGKMLSDDTVCGTASTSPNRILRGHVWAQAMDTAAGDPTTVRVVVTLYQTIVFFAPEAPARSAP